MSSKTCQEAALTSSWAWAGTLASTLRARWMSQRWRRLRSKTRSAAPMSPSAPSEMTSSGARSMAGDQPGQEVRPGIMALGAAWSQPDQHRLAIGGDAPGDQHRFGAGAVVHLEVRAVQEQLLQGDVGQAARGPCLELVFNLLADAACGRLRPRLLGRDRRGPRRPARPRRPQRDATP